MAVPDNISNIRARNTWNRKPVGSQRASSPEGTPAYFDEVRSYRYGYETPWIPSTFSFDDMEGKDVLELGVGLGIDAGEMVARGARYTGLDITRNHLDLARQNLTQQFGSLPDFARRVRFVEGDLLTTELGQTFDQVYSFGVLHHIEHEASCLARIRELLSSNGVLKIGVYSKFSFFNAYLFASWIIRNRMQVPLTAWRSTIAEASPIDEPVVIKIRSRREVTDLLTSTGFRVRSYAKKGFVQNYIPVLGKRLAPDGLILNSCAKALGWYHCFECSKN